MTRTTTAAAATVVVVVVCMILENWTARTFEDGNKKESRDKSEGFWNASRGTQVPLRKDYNFVKEDELESNSSNERVEPICPRVTFNVKYKDRRIYGTRTNRDRTSMHSRDDDIGNKKGICLQRINSS
ncbi:hypothetical protein HZH66_010981 [Vespula vulgaris]|uniref:Uncharacterized protein n=1 Tax=Vespula vulgaris TaxID=7454 RepID=A0A834JJK1_VESVU|nr:hypothetical protein HZH66_010981 [Vespula vulgaris]